MINNWPEFTAYVQKQWPKEACGYIKDNVFIPMENTAANPYEDFAMEFRPDMDAVIHSHTSIPGRWRDVGDAHDARCPSLLDQRSQESSALPWGIVSCDGSEVSKPLWFGDQLPIPELKGRQYYDIVSDCLTLVRDWYRLNKKPVIPLFHRPTTLQAGAHNMFEQNYRECGFVNLPKGEPLKNGDLCFFSLGKADYINHVGVVSGPDKLLHHLQNKLSGEDCLSKWINRPAFRFAARHKSEFENL